MDMDALTGNLAMPTAIERIVVQTTPQEKRAIVAKAKKLDMTVSELIRTGVRAYLPADADLVALAEAAQASAERSMAAMDDAFVAVAASNARIARMEAAASPRQGKAP